MSKVGLRTRPSDEWPVTPNPDWAERTVPTVPVAPKAVDVVEDLFHPPGPMPVKLPTEDVDLADRVSVKVVCSLVVMVVWA